MAGELNLKKGAKIYMAYDVPIGSQPVFDMLVSFKENLDETVFLVSVPMGKDGEQVPIDESRKLLLRYGTGPVQGIIAGYADDVIQDGIHTYWKIRRVTEHRQFFKRTDERLKVSFFIEFTMDTFRELPDGTTEHEKAYTLDISYSGSAVYMNFKPNVGDVCELFMPGMGTGPGSDPISYLKANVCWVREAPKGNPFRFVTGFQYKFADEIAKERMKLYVLHVGRTLSEEQ